MTPDEARETDSLRRSFRIALGNHHELLQLLKQAAQPETYLRLMSSEEKADEFLDEVDRLLHNYLASLYALSQHVDKSRADATLRKGSRRALSGPAVALAQYVRRVSTHERPPLAVERMSAHRDSLSDPLIPTVGPVLVSQDLQTARGGLNDDARRYLADHSAGSNPAAVSVLALVQDSGAALHAAVSFWEE